MQVYTLGGKNPHFSMRALPEERVREGGGKLIAPMGVTTSEVYASHGLLPGVLVMREGLIRGPSGEAFSFPGGDFPLP
jgi:hypothetical protein